MIAAAEKDALDLRRQQPVRNVVAGSLLRGLGHRQELNSGKDRVSSAIHNCYPVNSSTCQPFTAKVARACNQLLANPR
jgi:hypothetical protein